MRDGVRVLEGSRTQERETSCRWMKDQSEDDGGKTVQTEGNRLFETSSFQLQGMAKITMRQSH